MAMLHFGEQFYTLAIITYKNTNKVMWFSQLTII